MVTNQAPVGGSREAAQQFWRLPDQSEEARAAAWSFADQLEKSSPESDRRQNHLKYASQYLGRPVMSLSDFEAATTQINSVPGVTGRTQRNLVRTLVDTALSRFAKAETRCAFLTDGGTPVQQKRAEDGTQAANALIEQTKSERELRFGALHACVFDIGAVKVIQRDEGPETEHTAAWELMFDSADAHRRKPKILVQRMPVDREALVADYAIPAEDATQEEIDRCVDLADAIRNSGSGLITPDHTQSNQHTLAYELWVLPLGRMKGRHFVITDRALCLDEEWTEKTFPFVFFGWSAPLTGMYPESIAAIVSAVQDELDGIVTRESQIMRLMAIPFWTDEGPMNGEGDIGVAQVRGGTDAIGDIVHVPPGHKLTRLPAGPVVGGELFSQEDRVWTRGFQMTGISEQAAQGTRPAGLNSAPAQREWNEINQDRLSLVALDYQQAHVDLADLLIKAIAKIPDYEISVLHENGRWLRKMKASDLNLEDADFVIGKYPIGALPTTPTGQLAAGADLLQMQAITVDEFRDLVKFPDLKRALSLDSAAEKATQKIITRMLETGRYEAPDDLLVADPKNYAAKYAAARKLDGIAEDMAPDRLQLLQDWLDDISARQKQNAPAPAAPPPGATSVSPIPPPPLAPLPSMPPGVEMQAAA